MHAYLVKQADRARRRVKPGDRLYAHQTRDGRLHERPDIRDATRFRNTAHAEAARVEGWSVWAPTTTLGAEHHA